MTAASLLLVLASVAIFAGIYSSADHRVPVLTVVTTIHQGQPITGSDLGTADVATSTNLAPIPLSGAAALSGTWAAVTLPAGSLLTLADVATKRPLPVGSAVVGLSLKEGQLPSAGVEPGDLVMIIQTPAPGAVLPVAGSGITDGSSVSTDGSGATAAASGAGVLVAQAAVFETAPPSPSSASGAAELVSVEVPSTETVAVAAAAAASEVTLVLLPAVSAGPGRTPGP